MFQIKFLEKIKTHILCSVTFSGNQAVYEVMSKHFVELEATNGNTIYRMQVAYWTNNATRARTHARIHAPWHPYTLALARTHTPARAYTQRNM